jgi:hypothetical protein
VRDGQRELDVGQPAGRDAQQPVQQPGRRDVRAERLEQGRVGPERHQPQLVAVPGQVRRQCGDGRGGDPHLLPAHRAGHVHDQDHGAARAHPLAHHDVGVLGHRALGEHLDGAVEVDVVGPVPVGHRRQPAGAPFEAVGARAAADGQPAADALGHGRHLAVRHRLGEQLIDLAQLRGLTGDQHALPADLAVGQRAGAAARPRVTDERGAGAGGEQRGRRGELLGPAAQRGKAARGLPRARQLDRVVDR